jgi:hypothetical protein
VSSSVVCSGAAFAKYTDLVSERFFERKLDIEDPSAIKVVVDCGPS